MAHNVFVAHTLVVGLGDEADAQRMRAEPVEPVDHNPGHGDAMGEDLPHRIGMQRGVANPITGADFSKQRPGFSASDCLPGLERAHRAGFHMASARQADLSPLPCLIGFSPNDAQSEPVGDDADVLNTQRHQLGAAQCADEAEQ